MRTGEIISMVWQYLKGYRKPLSISLILLLVSVPLTNFHPLIWGWVADRLIDKNLSLYDLILALFVMALTYFAGLGLHSIHSYVLEKSGQAFIKDIRCALFQKFETQSLDFHKNSSTGELVSRITSDVDAMEQSVLHGLTTLLEELVTFVIVASMVLWISPIVGSLSILPLAFAFIFIKLYNKKVKSVYESVRKELGGIGSFVQDRLAGILISQIFVQEKREQGEFNKRAEAFFRSSVQASKMRNQLIPLISSFGFINNLVMLGVGSWLILQGNTAFTVGGLLAYRGFWWRLQSPVRTLAQTSDIAQRARAAAQRVVVLLKQESTIQDGFIDTIGDINSIEFNNVGFSYSDGKKVLNEVSFTVKSGEFITIAGNSGSGKSSLLNLICRFYDPSSGSIIINGRDAKDYKLEILRSKMGLVGQDNYLFDGSIAENIRYSCQNLDHHEVAYFARAANAHAFIEELPEKYMTHVGQNGIKLSGGQRQRISLARTLISKPKILLLDEPTASVEPESEALIYDSIVRHAESKDRITILVTHRTDLLKQSKRILFFKNGSLIADGSHQDLMSDCNAYVDAYHKWYQK